MGFPKESKRDKKRRRFKENKYQNARRQKRGERDELHVLQPPRPKTDSE